MDIKTVTAFPRKVKEIENIFIPLKDGTKLAATHGEDSLVLVWRMFRGTCRT